MNTHRKFTNSPDFNVEITRQAGCRTAEGRLSRLRTCKKFTLIEMLVVIAIIGILAGMLMPSLRKAQETAVAMSCTSNQKQVVLAMIQYSNNFNGLMPNYGQANLAYWTYPLTDSMELPRDIYRTPGTLFYCPGYDATKTEITSHTRVYGINPNVIHTKWKMNMNKTVGPSKVLLYGDKMPNGSDYILVPTDTVMGYWGIYGNITGSKGVWTGSSSSKVPAYWRHNEGVNFAFADGHAEAKGPDEVCRTKTDIEGSIWAWFNW